LIDNDKYSKHQKKILVDLEKKRPLWDKVNTWPKLLFKKKIDLTKGAGKEFNKLKDIRNKLVHFAPNYRNIDLGNFRINNLVDISQYEKIDIEIAKNSPKIVLDFASELFRLAGCKSGNIKQQIHIWFGDLSRIKKEIPQTE
jgi:hypothetical protein